MKLSRCVITVVSALLGSTTVLATPLKIVNVSAPAINCIFNAQCKATPTDSTATFSWPSSVTTSATASLQSRTFTGDGNTPGAGKTAYLYRVIAIKGGSTDCVTGLTVDFGPITQLDYNKLGVFSDIFVITKGGLGSVGVASADQTGSKVTLTFTQGICNTVAQSSFFFGLTAAGAAKSTTAQAKVLGAPNINSVDVTASAPIH